MLNELMTYYARVDLLAGRKHVPPSHGVQERDMKVIMTILKEVDTPKCQTEARMRTAAGKRTYLSTHVSTLALAEMYGVREGWDRETKVDKGYAPAIFVTYHLVRRESR